MSQVRRQTAVLPRPNWGWQDAAACRGEDLMLFFGPDGEHIRLVPFQSAQVLEYRLTD